MSHQTSNSSCQWFHFSLGSQLHRSLPRALASPCQPGQRVQPPSHLVDVFGSSLGHPGIQWVLLKFQETSPRKIKKMYHCDLQMSKASYPSKGSEWSLWALWWQQQGLSVRHGERVSEATVNTRVHLNIQTFWTGFRTWMAKWIHKFVSLIYRITMSGPGQLHSYGFYESAWRVVRLPGLRRGKFSGHLQIGQTCRKTCCSQMEPWKYFMEKTLTSLEKSSNRLTIQPTQSLVLFIVTLEAWTRNLKNSTTKKSWPSLCSKELCL